ncbi:hypothetical protein TNIN_499931 [Trichonephila inaurata madagascariensis]|uniref:Uncharacterized protein n=1 Tax=Trichonephila inaurata madagascariensis TaxID=2747483 RepID=A0A8X6WR21_9ARAC|nr:hypothetical protein TNIN_499931 [Trichonephila inaurata madagascariensis]
MKVFVVALVLVACLAFCEAKGCRFTEECEEDECCVSRSIFGRGNGKCEKLADKVKTSDVCFLHPNGLCFLTRGIGLIASRQEIPGSVLGEVNDGDSPLPLALLEETSCVGMSDSPLVKATAVLFLESPEKASTCLLAIGLLVGYRVKSQ